MFFPLFPLCFSVPSYLTSIFNSFFQYTDDNIIKDSMKFKFSILQDAMSHFSLENKLGEGGFGAVYKVILPT